MAGAPHLPAQQLELIAELLVQQHTTRYTSESNQEPFNADLGQTKMAAWLSCIPALRKKKFILVFIKSGSRE